MRDVSGHSGLEPNQPKHAPLHYVVIKSRSCQKHCEQESSFRCSRRGNESRASLSGLNLQMMVNRLRPNHATQHAVTPSSPPHAHAPFHYPNAQVLYCGMSEEELPSYDEKADVWSLGVLVYEALTGVQPFFADTVPDMIALQALSFTRFSLPESPFPDFISKQQLSPNAQAFISAALTLNPSHRPSTAELLKHPWLSPESFRDALVPRRSLSCNDAGSLSLSSISLAGVEVSILIPDAVVC